jgi:hypothetical protein
MISMSGTCVFMHYRKTDIPAENTTEADIDCGNQLARQSSLLDASSHGRYQFTF